jgi:hypothetical protein
MLAMLIMFLNLQLSSTRNRSKEIIMAIQFSTTVRNARLDAIETTIGISARLRFYSGAQPANCSLAASGTLLAELLLPSDYMNAAAGGAKDKLGTWQDASADASGTFGYFRIVDSTGVTCHVQGSCGISAADIIVDAATVTLGQTFTVVTFSLSESNA